MSSVTEIVEGYIAALAAGDPEQRRTFLSDENFSFHGPLDTFDNADDFVTATGRLTPILQEVEKRALLVSGKNAVAIYNLVTNTPAGTSRVAEWYGVENGKITSVEVFFDARPFAAMFQQ